MEFTQFHPTSFYRPDGEALLISEAVRGEGGVLRLPGGEAFMARFDSRGDLAPRDIVARAIDHEMKRLGIPCVYLDISHRPPEFVRRHFPTLYRRCLDYGVDMTAAPIPVVPAAHYTCGGIVVDLDARTDLPGLYAAGECACTGLHGANRLASNSLLECGVPTWRGGGPCRADGRGAGAASVMGRAGSKLGGRGILSHDRDEIRRLMWDYVDRARRKPAGEGARPDRVAETGNRGLLRLLSVTPRLIELALATVPSSSFGAARGKPGPALSLSIPGPTIAPAARHRPGSAASSPDRGFRTFSMSAACLARMQRRGGGGGQAFAQGPVVGQPARGGRDAAIPAAPDPPVGLDDLLRLPAGNASRMAGPCPWPRKS